MNEIEKEQKKIYDDQTKAFMKDRKANAAEKIKPLDPLKAVAGGYVQESMYDGWESVKSKTGHTVHIKSENSARNSKLRVHSAYLSKTGAPISYETGKYDKQKLRKRIMDGEFDKHFPAKKVNESVAHKVGDTVYATHPIKRYTTMTGKVTRIGNALTTITHKDGSTGTYPHKDVSGKYETLNPNKSGRSESVDESEFKGTPKVSTDKYSWGTMKTIHHGQDFSIPLHPEHHQAISKLKDSESHSFQDETKAKWTATRKGDTVHFAGKQGYHTAVPHASLHEDVNEVRLSYDDFMKGRSPIPSKSDDELAVHAKKKPAGPGSGTWKKLIKTEIEKRKRNESMDEGRFDADKKEWQKQNAKPKQLGKTEKYFSTRHTTKGTGAADKEKGVAEGFGDYIGRKLQVKTTKGKPDPKNAPRWASALGQTPQGAWHWLEKDGPLETPDSDRYFPLSGKTEFTGFRQNRGYGQGRYMGDSVETLPTFKEFLTEDLHPAAQSLLKHIKPEHHGIYKPYLKKKVFNGSYKDRSDVLKAAGDAGHLKESLDEGTLEKSSLSKLWNKHKDSDYTSDQGYGNGSNSMKHNSKAAEVIYNHVASKHGKHVADDMKTHSNLSTYVAEYGHGKDARDAEKEMQSLRKKHGISESVFDWKKNKSEVDWKSDDKKTDKSGEHKGTYGSDTHVAPNDRKADGTSNVPKKSVGRPAGEYQGQYKIDRAKREDPKNKEELSKKIMAAKAKNFATRKDPNSDYSIGKEFQQGLQAAIKKRQEELWHANPANKK